MVVPRVALRDVGQGGGEALPVRGGGKVVRVIKIIIMMIIMIIVIIKDYNHFKHNKTKNTRIIYI